MEDSSPMSHFFSALTFAGWQAPAPTAQRVPGPGRAVGRAVPRGFTLLEMLVVLIITSLAAGLLMEASTHVLGLQQRLNAQLERLRGPALSADWLRQVVQGLQPDYDDGAHRFTGTARGFAGLTTNALSGAYGGLEPFAVVLQHDAATDTTTLRYAPGAGAGAVAGRMADALPEDVNGAGRAVVLLRWPGNAQRLRYWDDKGAPHEDWPPPLGQWPPLPRAITLEGDGNGNNEGTGAPWVVVATHQGPLWPTLRPRDVMGMGVAP